MRSELRVARLREDQRQYAAKVHEAAMDLIRHQDSVAVLAVLGKATMSDQQGLREAQAVYDRASAKLALVTNELLQIIDGQKYS